MSAQKKDNNYRYLGVDENGNEKLFKHKDKLKKAGYKFVKKVLVEKEEKKKTVEKPKVTKTINYKPVTPEEVTTTLNPIPGFIPGLDSHVERKPEVMKMKAIPTIKTDENGNPKIGLAFARTN